MLPLRHRRTPTRMPAACLASAASIFVSEREDLAVLHAKPAEFVLTCLCSGGSMRKHEPQSRMHDCEILCNSEKSGFWAGHGKKCLWKRLFTFL